MAILFDCPYCTAPIKVADAAAGKVGRCPKCETKLTVPIPPRKPGEAPHPPAIADAQSPPPTTPAAASSIPAETPPVLETPATPRSPATSSAPKPPVGTSKASAKAAPPSSPLPPRPVVRGPIGDIPVTSDAGPSSEKVSFSNVTEPDSPQNSQNVSRPEDEIVPGIIPARGSFLRTSNHHAGTSDAESDESTDFNFSDRPTSGPSLGEGLGIDIEAGGDAVTDFPVVVDEGAGVFVSTQGADGKKGGGSSYADRIKQQRKTSWGRMVIPLILGVGLLVIGGGYYFSTRATFTGPMEAEVVADGFPLEIVIDRGQFPLPPDRVERMLAEFRDDPRVLMKELAGKSFGTIRFQGDEQGLRITHNPGPDVRVVRVDLRGNVPLIDFVKQQVVSLDQPRLQIVRSGAEKFARVWDSATSSGMRMGNVGDFMESLGRESMCGSLGHHLVARVGIEMYQCTFQDVDGRLYFLLPHNVTVFELVERSVVDGGASVFPTKFEFVVTILAPAASKSSPTTETTPSTTEPPAKTEETEGTKDPEAMTTPNTEVDGAMMLRDAAGMTAPK
ncbi:MAG: hypothetical protein R3C01_16795 [Planctomycetaceae bacterium]